MFLPHHGMLLVRTSPYKVSRPRHIEVFKTKTRYQLEHGAPHKTMGHARSSPYLSHCCQKALCFRQMTAHAPSGRRLLSYSFDGNIRPPEEKLCRFSLSPSLIEGRLIP